MTRQDDIRNRAPHAILLPARLHGILIPFPTPFDSEGEVDVRALASNLEGWSGTGVSGFVALGSTGERVHLSADEVRRVVETARASVPDSSLFIVGVGTHATRTTILEATEAARAGADAVLLITPHFYRGAMSQGALAEHYEAVADSSHAPVIIYNIPQNTGVAVAPETVARLAEHQNIIGIKDSSGDMVNFVEMLRLAGRRDDFVLMTGHGGLLYPSLCSGAGGAILAVASVMPEMCVAIRRAFASGEHERARSLQEQLLPVARAVTTRYGIGGLKHAMTLRGYAGGAVRAPLQQPDEAARVEIERLVREAERAFDEDAGAS